MSRRPRAKIVERKGLGHPDTLCDAIAESVSLRLSRHYLDRFGVILHHNVDTVLLCGGASRVAFGGGELLEPMADPSRGRGDGGVARGTKIPVLELALAACRELLKQRLPEIDLDRHVWIIPRLRPGSRDLTRIFGRSGTVTIRHQNFGAR